jgi:hypothetical protein
MGTRLQSGLTAAALGILLTAAGASQSAFAATGAETVASTVSSASSATDHDGDECREYALPAQVIGAPTVTAGAAAGARVWHDSTGWHVRITHPGHDAVEYTDTISSPGVIKAAGYRLEGHDSLAVAADKHSVTFHLVNRGAIDGIDFTDSCSAITRFTFLQNKNQLSPVSVWLGAHGAHPTSQPFTIERHYTGH